MLAARPHAVNSSRGGFVAVVKALPLARLRPEGFVVAVGIEQRGNVFQIHAGVGQFLELVQIVAAVNDAGSTRAEGLPEWEAAGSA